MPANNGLTARQRNILDFVVTFQDEHGYPPSIREIGDFFKIRSTNGVSDHLRALERKGWLARSGQQSRGLSIVRRPDDAPENRRKAGHGGASTVQVPVLGRVAAGLPLLAVEQVEETVAVDPAMLGGSGAEVFGLRVKGRSMVDAGILPGDLVFVRRQPTADNGRIAVVMLEGEATVKRFYHEGDRIRLQAENADMPPILIDREDAADCQVLGHVVGVWRRVH